MSVVTSFAPPCTVAMEFIPVLDFFLAGSTVASLERRPSLVGGARFFCLFSPRHFKLSGMRGAEGIIQLFNRTVLPQRQLDCST